MKKNERMKELERRLAKLRLGQANLTGTGTLRMGTGIPPIQVNVSVDPFGATPQGRGVPSPG